MNYQVSFYANKKPKRLQKDVVEIPIGFGRSTDLRLMSYISGVIEKKYGKTGYMEARKIKPNKT